MCGCFLQIEASSSRRGLGGSRGQKVTKSQAWSSLQKQLLAEVTVGPACSEVQGHSFCELSLVLGVGLLVVTHDPVSNPSTPTGSQARLGWRYFFKMSVHMSFLQRRDFYSWVHGKCHSTGTFGIFSHPTHLFACSYQFPLSIHLCGHILSSLSIST